MPSELSSFKLARAAVRACPDDRRPPLRLEDWLRASELLATLVAADPGDLRGVAADWSGLLPAREVTSIADLDIPHAEHQEIRAAPDDLAQAIERIVDREVVTGSTTGSFEDADPLYEDAWRLAELLVLASIVGAAPTTLRILHRALLVLGLVELTLLAFDAVESADLVLQLLRDRLILLPRQVFPLPYRAAVARHPGFADLHVVRQEWNRYVAGEIAHVENVLPGELKRQTLTRTGESDTTETTETERTETTERDLQSTSRFELSDETSSDTSMIVHVEGQVDTSGQYGPTKVDTHLGGSLDFSREDTERHATQQASEIVARAVRRAEERARSERVVRKLTRVVDKNVHELNNANSEPVVGTYPWIDKIVRLQRFRYPHRYILELQVPEPAAYVRWLQERNRDRGYTNPLPVPFTLNASPQADDNPALLPTDISEDSVTPGYYLRLATHGR